MIRKSRFSEEQVIGILKEHQAGLPGGRDLPPARRHVPTFYTWRSKYSGLEVSEAKRLKASRGGGPQAQVQEAARRADAGRGNATRDAGKKLLTPSSRRQAVRWVIGQKRYSQRRACGLLGLAPKTYRYRSGRSDDGELRRRLRELATERSRFAASATAAC